MKVLVTGSSGFVGSALVKHLECHPTFQVIRTTRKATVENEYEDQTLRELDLANLDSRIPDFSDIDTIVHLAGKAHDIGQTDQAASQEYFTINADAVCRLANAAVASGVRRFVFLSSIKVNGDKTLPGHPFTCHSIPNPIGAYAESKLMAEEHLFNLAQETDLEVVVIRPPLVYGPGFKGNLEKLSNFIAKRVPLPIGAISRNRRSMVGINNLVSLITTCITKPEAKNKLFLVSDNEDISTKELANYLGLAIGKKPLLFSVPTALISLGAGIFGRRQAINKLVGSLQVDISETCETLAWKPPHTVEQGMKKQGQP
jgi:nucleoside-diphosphate-sugar epimerase